MTIDEAQHLVKEIADSARYFEKAHVLEDDLRALVLRSIADDPECPFRLRTLAEIALSTDAIKFPRHCA